MRLEFRPWSRALQWVLAVALVCVVWVPSVGSANLP
jgi:hypothetical protein